jgi:hypothetical protein
MIIDFKCTHCNDEWIVDGDEGYFNEQELHEVEQHGNLANLCEPCKRDI